MKGKDILVGIVVASGVTCTYSWTSETLVLYIPFYKTCLRTTNLGFVKMQDK